MAPREFATIITVAVCLFVVSVPGIGAASSGPDRESNTLETATSNIEINYTIQINNTQPIPTGTYQQSFSFDPCVVVNLDKNLSNLRILYPNGTAVQTWIQSTGCPISTVWMRLSSVPAEQQQNLSLVAEPEFVLSPSGPTGEAPTLSPLYGEWDNGARVFALYDNFSGTTLSRLWTFTDPDNTSYRVSNGLDIYSSSAPDAGGIWSTTAYSGAYWAEIDLLGFNYDGGNPGVDIGLSTDAASWGYLGGPGSSYVTFICALNASTTIIGYNNATSALVPLGPNVSYSLPGGVVGLVWSSTGSQAAEVNGTEIAKAFNSSLPIGPVHMSIGISGAHYSVTKSVIQWARLRAYPPNGVMPSTSFAVSEMTIPAPPVVKTCAAFSSTTPIFGGQCEATSIALVVAIAVIVVLSVLLLAARRQKSRPPPPEPAAT